MVEWIYTGALFATMAINLVVLRMRVPILSFVFSILSFGIGAYSMGNENVVFGYTIPFAVIMLAALSAFYSVYLWRNE